MKKLLRNAMIINEGKRLESDLLIKDGRIEKIAQGIAEPNCEEIDLNGLWLIPGIIDDQVHFREPGLTHKASIYTESRAAAAGGVTSFMEMPNVKPPTLTQELLEKKYEIGERDALINYSFFMGVSNDNLDEALRTDMTKVCGLKIFMGSSTGNMLVDDEQVLEAVFARTPMLIATHCEDEKTVLANLEHAKQRYGDDIPFNQHPIIRSEEACLLSSSKAVELAKKHNARLHILHISTEEELGLFDSSIPLRDKRVTSEVCVHHLYFDAGSYDRLGSQLKCNPSVKDKRHREALLKALKEGRIDIIATDHAPHTIEEKANNYLSAPSGLPLVQHALTIMLDFYHKGLISAEEIVTKMCHAPADCFRVSERGYIREGYFADLVIVDPSVTWTIDRGNIMYKCGWSPLEGRSFDGRVVTTIVNGEIVYHQGRVIENKASKRLTFETV